MKSKFILSLIIVSLVYPPNVMAAVKDTIKDAIKGGIKDGIKDGIKGAAGDILSNLTGKKSGSGSSSSSNFSSISGVGGFLGANPVGAIANPIFVVDYCQDTSVSDGLNGIGNFATREAEAFLRPFNDALRSNLDRTQDLCKSLDRATKSIRDAQACMSSDVFSRNVSPYCQYVEAQSGLGLKVSPSQDFIFNETHRWAVTSHFTEASGLFDGMILQEAEDSLRKVGFKGDVTKTAEKLAKGEANLLSLVRANGGQYDGKSSGFANAALNTSNQLEARMFKNYYLNNEIKEKLSKKSAGVGDSVIAKSSLLKEAGDEIVAALADLDVGSFRSLVPSDALLVIEDDLIDNSNNRIEVSTKGVLRYKLEDLSQDILDLYKNPGNIDLAEKVLKTLQTFANTPTKDVLGALEGMDLISLDEALGNVITNNTPDAIKGELIGLLQRYIGLFESHSIQLDRAKKHLTYLRALLNIDKNSNKDAFDKFREAVGAATRFPPSIKLKQDVEFALLQSAEESVVFGKRANHMFVAFDEDYASGPEPFFKSTNTLDEIVSQVIDLADENNFKNNYVNDLYTLSAADAAVAEGMWNDALDAIKKPLFNKDYPDTAFAGFQMLGDDISAQLSEVSTEYMETLKYISDNRRELIKRDMWDKIAEHRSNVSQSMSTARTAIDNLHNSLAKIKRDLITINSKGDDFKDNFFSQYNVLIHKSMIAENIREKIEQDMQNIHNKFDEAAKSLADAINKYKKTAEDIRDGKLSDKDLPQGISRLYAVTTDDVLKTLPATETDYLKSIELMKDAITSDLELIEGGYQNILTPNKFLNSDAGAASKAVANYKRTAKRIHEAIDRAAEIKLGFMYDYKAGRYDIAMPTQAFVKEFAPASRPAIIAQIQRQQRKNAFIAAQIAEETAKKKNFINIQVKKALILSEEFDEEQARQAVSSKVNAASGF